VDPGRCLGLVAVRSAGRQDFGGRDEDPSAMRKQARCALSCHGCRADRSGPIRSRGQISRKHGSRKNRPADHRRPLRRLRWETPAGRCARGEQYREKGGRSVSSKTLCGLIARRQGGKPGSGPLEAARPCEPRCARADILVQRAAVRIHAQAPTRKSQASRRLSETKGRRKCSRPPSR